MFRALLAGLSLREPSHGEERSRSLRLPCFLRIYFWSQKTNQTGNPRTAQHHGREKRGRSWGRRLCLPKGRFSKEEKAADLATPVQGLPGPCSNQNIWEGGWESPWFPAGQPPSSPRGEPVIRDQMWSTRLWAPWLCDQCVLPGHSSSGNAIPSCFNGDQSSLKQPGGPLNWNEILLNSPGNKGRGPK